MTPKTTALAVVAMFFAGIGAVAHSEEQADSATLETIREIRVDGLKRVDREAVVGVLTAKVGQAIDPARATQDLRAVWKTGLFRDVRIDKEPMESGWRLIVTVVEKPSIGEVKYVGNDDLSNDDIKAVVDVKPFSVLNIDLIKKNAQKIRELYVEKGHYLAQVDYRIESDKANDQQVTVYFDIIENAKVMVREIRFVGNAHIPADTIKGVLQTREGHELSWMTQSGTYKEEFFQTDLFRIQALYYDYGYVTIKVGEPTTLISPDRRFIYLTVPIDEGEQYNIGDISFSGDVVLKDEHGASVIDEEVLKKHLRVRTGETFNRTKLFEDIQALTDVYRDRGYAYANVTPNSNVDPKTRKVSLDLEVERGDVVSFERIEIVGNTRTRDKVIRREMRIIEGERYSATKLNESKARVYQLGFFETVNMNTSRGSKPDRMNVTVEIKEKPTGTFQVGAGFSSVESFIMTAQISQNNFLGNGQLLSVSAQLSFGQYARQLVNLQYYEPYLLDTEWSLGMDAYITQRLYSDFQRNSTGASPRLGYPITPDLRLSVGYTFERIDITDESGSLPVALAGLNRDGYNSSVIGSIQYDTRDNRLFPSAGQYHVLSLEVSDHRLGTSMGLEYNRAQFYARYYHPLFLSVVLKLNAEFGYVFGGGSLGVPISERFAPGGIYSVRGFELRGLGPIEHGTTQGDPLSATRSVTVGGNKEAVFNLELEFPLLAAAGIKGVLFADAGNAYDDSEGLFYLGTQNSLRPKGYLMRTNRAIDLPLGLYYSFGFGFRWFSPIGPLRFEWGFPVTKRNPEDRSMIFEFTIGNFF